MLRTYLEALGVGYVLFFLFLGWVGTGVEHDPYRNSVLMAQAQEVEEVDMRVDRDSEIPAGEEDCMALNIYHEARGSSLADQVAVAQVTLTRVEAPEWPGSVCQVVWQKNQFSWTNDGLPDSPKEREAWEKARVVAEMVMEGLVIDPSDGADHYHTPAVRPSWTSADFKMVGAHKYMRLRGEL